MRLITGWEIVLLFENEFFINICGVECILLECLKVGELVCWLGKEKESEAVFWRIFCCVLSIKSFIFFGDWCLFWFFWFDFFN